MIEYLYSAWMKKYRPSGKGTIEIRSSLDSESIPIKSVICDEVICDFCNDEIPATDKDGEETSIWMLSSYALCIKCMENGKVEYDLEYETPPTRGISHISITAKNRKDLERIFKETYPNSRIRKVSIR